MRQKSQTRQTGAAKAIKDIRRATRKQYSAEEKIRIVLDGLRGEETIAELCRREGIAQSIYYKWSKEFLEAGKRRLAGDTARAASPSVWQGECAGDGTDRGAYSGDTSWQIGTRREQWLSTNTWNWRSTARLPE